MQDLTMVSEYLAHNAMYVILLLMFIAFIAVLYKIQKTPDSFDLRSVIADENNKPSIHKIGQLTALVLSTWLLIYLALNSRINEGYFGTYMGIWAAAQVADKYLTGREKPPQDNSNLNQ